MEKYNIKIKTKKGTYEYEQDDLDDIEYILDKHPDNERTVEIKKDKVKSLGSIKKKEIIQNG